MVEIARKPAPSRALAEYGYDVQTQTFEAVFPPSRKTGESGVYRYSPVTPETVVELEAAESFGVAFGRLIKDDSNVTCEPIGKIVLETVEATEPQ